MFHLILAFKPMFFLWCFYLSLLVISIVSLVPTLFLIIILCSLSVYIRIPLSQFTMLSLTSCSVMLLRSIVCTFTHPSIAVLLFSTSLKFMFLKHSISKLTQFLNVSYKLYPASTVFMFSRFISFKLLQL